MAYTFQAAEDTGHPADDALVMADRYLLSAHGTLETAKEEIEDPAWSGQLVALGHAQATLAAAYLQRWKP